MLRLLPLLLLFVSFARLNARDNNAIDPTALERKIKQHAAEIKKLAEKENASTDFAILIDMSMPSNTKRFFVINLSNDSVVLRGQVGHGQGADYRNECVVFSNKEGSLCTSEGRYKIGNKYNCAFGTSYKLYGLDPTNSKAYERGIVIHAHKLINDDENKRACRSYGCPMVSPNMFAQLSKLLDASARPLLLWIYK